MPRPMIISALAGAVLITAMPDAQAQSSNSISRWDGPYAGVMGGGVWGSLKASRASTDLVWSGFTGYGFQLSALYFGGEVDITVGGARNLTTLSASRSISADVDWSLSARGRIGVVLDGAMIYATAGPAFARHKYEATDIGTRFSASAIAQGVVWGAGLETRLLPFLGVRFEALHYDYSMGNETVSKAIRGSVSGALIQGVTMDETVVRTGVFFRW